MIKINRKNQQAVVVSPIDNPDTYLVVRVIELLPNSVVLGIDGREFDVVRAENYKSIQGGSA